MKKIALATAVAAVCSVGVAQADTYNWEVQGNYTNIDNGFADVDGYGIDGTYYFQEVDDSKGPFSEAAFLNKASSVTLGYVDFDGSDSVSIAGRLVLDSNLTLEANYADADGSDVYGAAIGMYINDTSEVQLTYADSDADDADVWGVEYHGVYDLGDNAALAADLGLSTADAGEALTGGLTYYPMPQLGLGVDLAYLDYDDSDFGYGLSAEYFFTNSIFAGATYNSVDDADVDTYTLYVGARF